MAEDEVKDQAPSSEKKAPSHEKVALRKTAGVASMLVGLPNLIISLIAIIGGITAIVFILIMIISLLFMDTGDDACTIIIVLIFIIFLIIFLIIAVIFFTLSIFMAIIMSGQAIGGLLALKGRGFNGAVTLMTLGSVVSFIFGITTFIIGLVADWHTDLTFLVDFDTASRVLLVNFGLFDLFAAFITGASTITVMTTKSTFKRP